MQKCRSTKTCVAFHYGDVRKKCDLKAAFNKGRNVRSAYRVTSGRDCAIVPECEMNAYKGKRNILCIQNLERKKANYIIEDPAGR